VKGGEIAKKLNISTSALRHYEAWGLIPTVARAKNGYRIYTREHEAYFFCIRSMIPGFGVSFVKELMPLVKTNHLEAAMWKINKEQVNLYEEKQIIEQTIEILEPNVISELPQYQNKKNFRLEKLLKKQKFLHLPSVIGKKKS